MNVYNLFFNALIYCILIYFAFIVFKLIFGKLNIKEYFLENNLEFIIKKIISIIINLVGATLAIIGLYYIATIDLKFYSNIGAFILMILIIKFSIDFSFYILNNKFIKSLTEKIFNKKT
ncbi:hypothetical protein GNF80_16890 [Clostridium perfringens]|nr:hypothetical protein [Clostridium perfringens]